MPEIDDPDSFRRLVRECIDDAARTVGLEFNDLYRDSGWMSKPAEGRQLTRMDRSLRARLAQRLERLAMWRGRRLEFTRAFSVLYESSEPDEVLRARYPVLPSNYKEDPIVSFEMWIIYFPRNGELEARVLTQDVVEWATQNERRVAAAITDINRPLRERLTAVAECLPSALH